MDKEKQLEEMAQIAENAIDSFQTKRNCPYDRCKFRKSSIFCEVCNVIEDLCKADYRKQSETINEIADLLTELMIYGEFECFIDTNIAQEIIDIVRAKGAQKAQGETLAADVVRCNKCEYCKYIESAGVYKCDRRGYFTETVTPTDFCSKGKTKMKGGAEQ